MSIVVTGTFDPRLSHAQLELVEKNVPLCSKHPDTGSQVMSPSPPLNWSGDAVPDCTITYALLEGEGGASVTSVVWLHEMYAVAPALLPAWTAGAPRRTLAPIRTRGSLRMSHLLSKAIARC